MYMSDGLPRSGNSISDFTNVLTSMGSITNEIDLKYECIN